MKRFISLLSVVLFINIVIVKAQTTNAANGTSTNPKKEVTGEHAKQCHGVTAACPHPCTSRSEATPSSSSTTLSDSHSNTGQAPSNATKETLYKAKGKSCCKSVSKASIISGSESTAKKAEAPSRSAIVVPEQ